MGKEERSSIIDDVLEWSSGFKETDVRLMILIAASRIDDDLKSLLNSVMLHESGGSDRLFGNDRPLGSFSSRIILAYRLGLIDRDFESFLQTLRKLRNDSAHASTPLDISIPPHIDRVRSLFQITESSPVYKDLFGGFDPPLSVKDDPKRCLLTSFMIAVMNLECGIEQLEPFEAKRICSFKIVRAPSTDG